MTQDMISSYYEKARATLKSEHDSMAQKIKEEIGQAKRKALSRA